MFKATHLDTKMLAENSNNDLGVQHDTDDPCDCPTYDSSAQDSVYFHEEDAMKNEKSDDSGYVVKVK